MKLLTIVPLTLLLTIISVSCSLNAQPQTKVHFTPASGFRVISADSAMAFHLGIRLQEQLSVSTSLEEPKNIHGAFQTRRARIQGTGFVQNNKLGYFLQLNMDRGQISLSDARLNWNVNSSIALTFGQFRPPAGRQFQTSSQNLQMVDRSLVSRFFAVGYDQGVAFKTLLALGQNNLFKFYGSLTHGEGSNTSNNPPGFSYTLRGEWLPFGIFSGGGDYRESDLVKEKTPKLSLGSAIYINRDAENRTGIENSEVLQVYLDAVLKYKGYSFLGEYILGNLNTVKNGSYSRQTTGKGFSLQAGKIFEGSSLKLEPTFRYSLLHPDRDPVYSRSKLSAGLNYFLEGHHLKLQSELGLRRETLISGQSDLFLESLLQFTLSF